MRETQASLRALPFWVKALAAFILFCLYPLGWIVGLGLIVLMAWR